MTELREMTIGEVIESGRLGKFGEYLFTYMTEDHYGRQLASYGYEKAGFEEGFRCMEELRSQGECLHMKVYTERERRSSWDREQVEIEYFPALSDGLEEQRRPYVLIVPGGGFNRQWGCVEGQAIAARANALGLADFVLYYRVKQQPLLPLPMEDMYRAIQVIEEHADEWNLLPGCYMVGGFSAGGTIAGSILTDHLGWKKAGVPKPSLVFLGYTPTRMDEFYDLWKSLPEDSEAREGVAVMLRRVGGPLFSVNDGEKLREYRLMDHLLDADDAPKVYMVANEDDGTVPVSCSRAMAEALEKKGIPVCCRIGKTGGHSFGLGNGLEVEGWFDEAVRLSGLVSMTDGSHQTSSASMG